MPLRELKAEDLTDQEKDMVSSWETALHDARHSSDRKNFDKRVKSSRQAVKGFMPGQGKRRVKANIIHSTLQTLLPRTYAKNPEIAVVQKETIDSQAPQWVKPFAKTLELVINYFFEEAQLKRKAKRALRSAQVTSIGWLKPSWQRNYGEDPEIAERLADSQDNLKRIESLKDSIADEDDRHSELARKQEELKHQVEALTEQAEIIQAEGLAIDVLNTDDVVVDPSITELELYREAAWIAQRIWYESEDFESKFGIKADGGKHFVHKDDNHDERGAENTKQQRFKVAVWEIWCRRSMTIYTICEGMSGYVRDPYRPPVMAERFYPFFLLTFNQVDGEFFPESDVDLLIELQLEYDNIRKRQEMHRAMSIPGWVGDASVIDKKAVKTITHQVIGEIALIDTSGVPISSALQERGNPHYNPMIYDTGPVRADVDLVSGTSDAARGAVSKAKTATEASYLEEGLDSRVAERRDTMEDLIQEMAVYVAQILLLSDSVTQEQVERIAGPGFVWPDYTKREAYELIQVEVRAGTSSKPNQAQLQENWIQLLPILREMLTQVAELQEAGQQHLADAIKAVLRETMRRFDERLDIEDFLPSPQETEEANQPNPQQQMQEQLALAEMQKQLEKLQAEIVEIQSKAELNKAKAQSEIVETQMAVMQPQIRTQ